MSLTCDRIYVCITIANRTCDSFVFVAWLILFLQVGLSIDFACGDDMYIYIVNCTSLSQVILCDKSSFLLICFNEECLRCPIIRWALYAILYKYCVIHITVGYYQLNVFTRLYSCSYVNLVPLVGICLQVDWSVPQDVLCLQTWLGLWLELCFCTYLTGGDDVYIYIVDCTCLCQFCWSDYSTLNCICCQSLGCSSPII